MASNQELQLLTEQPVQDQSVTSLAEMHSLYQDLFLTDIKKDVETAQSELKECKQEQNSINFEH